MVFVQRNLGFVWQVPVKTRIRLQSLGPGLAGEQSSPMPDLADRILGGSLRLPVDQVGHSGHGVDLVLLVGVGL